MSKKEEKWYLDNGCPRHITGGKSMFSCLTFKKGGYVNY